MRECVPSEACGAVEAANISTMFHTRMHVPSEVACAALPLPLFHEHSPRDVHVNHEPLELVDGTCAPGYVGQACATCDRPKHYYRLEGECHKCPDSDATLLILLVGVVVVIVAPVLFKVSEQAKNFPALNIGISFSQTLGLFSFQMDYPEGLTRLLSSFSFFSLNLAGGVRITSIENRHEALGRRCALCSEDEPNPRGHGLREHPPSR